jgi:beta-aspartyl-peptidase (threonine type)
VMMAGKGAETFAAEVGLEQVDPKYFYTERRWNSLQRILKKEEVELEFTADDVDKKQGTVGCVALDKNGNIAAGTSTGGMTNKRYDRIGDSPVIGAGTFADNLTCGVSATGHGEFFIRFTVARDISAMMEYGGYTLKEASEKIINEKLVEKGGAGGVVALDRYGNISMPFNTSGMYRGWRKPGKQYVGIYKGE